MLRNYAFAAGLLAASGAYAQDSLTLKLSPVQTWQCESQASQARAFAHEMVAFKGKDCSQFLANSREIFAPLTQAVSFGSSSIYRQCYAAAYRDELARISDRIVGGCASDVDASLNAGSVLGRFVCRAAQDDALPPELSFGTILGSKFDPNTGEPTVKLVVPVRSEIWAAQLSTSQEAGFELGCISGEMETIQGIPFEGQVVDGERDWIAIGQNIGEAFGAAYCPIEEERVQKVLDAMVSVSSVEAKESNKAVAREGFEKGFQSACNKTFSPAL